MQANVVQNNDAGFGGDEVEVLTYFQDNGEQENYYLYRHQSNRVAFPQYQVENDENDNGTQDENYMGIPEEGFGFSWNPKIKYGPASYKAAKFQVNEAELALTIKMIYL